MSSSLLLQEPWSAGFSILFRLDEVLLRRKTPHQEIVIGRNGAYGLCLFLDELIQSTEVDEALYHEAFVHPALVIHGAPRRVLVGGAGEGATLREIYKHRGVEQVVTVDLDAAVVEACREFLPTWSAGAFDDPRTELRIEDVRTTLGSAAAGSFDAVLLDVTDPVEEGPSVELFTTAFFEEVARVLDDEGIVVLQSGEIDLSDFDPIRAVRSTLAAVFDWVHVCHINVPSFHAMWSVTLAGKRTFEPRPQDLQARIEALGAEHLRAYSRSTHLAMLDLPPGIAAEVAKPGRVVTGADADRIIAQYDRN